MMEQTDIEAGVHAFIDGRREALLNFASRLIAAPTPNPPGGERRAAAVAAEELHALGFEDVVIVGPRSERANVICRHATGRPGPALILNGHLDTKPPVPRDAWVADPYTPVVRDGRLYGLGAADMKGPDAALAYGLAAALAVGADKLRGEVLLVFSADEEGDSTDGVCYLLEEQAIQGDAVFIAEPCGVVRPWEVIPVISRGISCLRFTVTGTQTHSSIGDRVPVVNASLEAARLLLFLNEHLALTYEPTSLCPVGPTINLGATVTAGEAVAMVSGQAEFTADIRTLPGMSLMQLAADVERAVAEFRGSHPGVGVSWEFFAGKRRWTQPTQISDDEPLAQAARMASRVILGESPSFGYFPGGTDAIWWQAMAGIPTLPGFGPGLLSNCHQPNEWITVDELYQAAKIDALIVLHYLSVEA
jgi:acetylornithine deacetylase/succinyl-diaminopimelate desuccinylase-like protein